MVWAKYSLFKYLDFLGMCTFSLFGIVIGGSGFLFGHADP